VPVFCVKGQEDGGPVGSLEKPKKNRKKKGQGGGCFLCTGGISSLCASERAR